MASVVISGDTSGTITVSAPAVAGSNTLSLPAGTGSVVVNGVNGSIVSGTTVASTSGTSIDFTGIPSWVKRITVMFNGVSTNGTSSYQVQIGSGSITTSGYAWAGGSTSTGNQTATSGFLIFSNSATDIMSGTISIVLVGSNTWVESHVIGMNQAGTGYGIVGGGSIALGGTLDRLRITTVNGTDTFDAGSVNILYE
jgi:hypothetical protein